MIGIFDSGYGGLTILKKLVEYLPRYSYLYYGDNANAPYGNKSEEEIFELTKKGVEYLILSGCELVIIACNTSSANSLRKIQQEFLPIKYSNKRVLGILVPTVEYVSELENIDSIVILATQSTTDSGSYEKELKKLKPQIKIVSFACPEFVSMIESGESEEKIREVAKKYSEELKTHMLGVIPDYILLGCTHYDIIEDIIRSEFDSKSGIIRQGELVGKKTMDYISRHPEIDNKLNKMGERKFITSGNPIEVSMLGSKFFGSKIEFGNE